MMSRLAPTLLRFSSPSLSAPREQGIQTETASRQDSANAINHRWVFSGLSSGPSRYKPEPRPKNEDLISKRGSAPKASFDRVQHIVNDKYESTL